MFRRFVYAALNNTAHLLTLAHLRMHDWIAGQPPETPTDRAIRDESERLSQALPQGRFRRPHAETTPAEMKEIAMSAIPQADPVPGEWYLGVRCAHCDEMVVFASDISRGHGRLGFFEADDRVQERCVRGHLTSFRLYEMQRFRWRPRLNS